MTYRSLTRPMTVLAGLAASAGLVTAAWAATGPEPDRAPRPAAAVVADLGLESGALQRAVTSVGARSGVDPASVQVRRIGGAPEATAQVSALASEHLTVVAGVGESARAAVLQAEGAELAPSTAWITVR
ncbi:MAG TPA: hypothetical protein VN238_09735 [Solirubrobacteraceae bacterium]|nr:hypothetical protein [Solirubrobacteraceae bacterium]